MNEAFYDLSLGDDSIPVVIPKPVPFTREDLVAMTALAEAIEDLIEVLSPSKEEGESSA